MFSNIRFQVNELTLSNEGLEKERDFYFSKLREIEVLCQECEQEDIPVIKKIFDVLYATEVLSLIINCCKC